MSARRVLFVAGWGRSGSTLVERALAQVAGVVSVGEVRELWLRGVVENQPCGCGEPFRTCAFWTQVGKSAFGGWEELDLDEVLRLRYSIDRPWMVPGLTSRHLWAGARSRAVRYSSILENLYSAIFEVSGADLLVDASKMASHGFLLRRIPWIDLRVLHFIRDSRAAAWSWQKVVERNSGSGPYHLPRYGPVAASARWLGYNAEASLLARAEIPYLRIRYEDFVRALGPSLERILRHAGVVPTPEDLAFVGKEELALGISHTVDGNPMRFSVGNVPVLADDAWKREMPGRQRRLVTAATLPGLIRYHYDLVGGP